MFEQFKNLKLVQKIKEAMSPKARWIEYSGKNSLDKSTTDYLEAISGVNFVSEEQEMEMMVREQLKKEFPNIENMKSYELLVDAVMHNIKKKQSQD